MGISLSDLPPELQRRILQQMNVEPSPKPRRPRVPKPRSGLMRRHSCGFEIFRPDGAYPDRCDSCGKRWPA